MPEEYSPEKQLAIDRFRKHVNSAKADFWEQVRMPLVLGKREGPFAWDMDGKKRVFNLHTNGGTYNLGHRNPVLIETLVQALKETDIGNGHLVSHTRARLGARLAELMPGDLEYTVFGVSGGEAVDLAFKVARAYTGRSMILSARGGYHGHTGLAMAAGDEKYRAPFGPQPPGFAQVPFGDADALQRAMDADTAAIILETIPATLGMPVPPQGYLKRVRDLCDRHGAIMIMDEVQTGLGRTGKLWGFEHFDILPDIVVIGKGFSGGIYPITATVLRTPLESVFHADPHIHVSTFGGAEPGCAVALKVLEISSSPEFLDHVNTLAATFKSGIARLADKYDILEGLRQIGLFMGLKMKDTSCGPLLSLAAYNNDLLMVYANNDKSVAQFLPPLNIDEKQAKWAMERLDRSLAEVQAFYQ
jgi:putrescine aminotransferase